MNTLAHTLMPVLLNPSHAALAHGLHEAIIDALDESEKSFILPKSLSYFFNHLSKGGGNAILGIMYDDALIAQGVIHNPTPDHPDGFAARHAREFQRAAGRIGSPGMEAERIDERDRQAMDHACGQDRMRQPAG